MPNDHGQAGTVLTPAQQFNNQLDEQVKNFRALLPSHIPVERFKRVVIVAISQNPELFKADRRSLFTAAQKCAADGLLPDGRQAALVIYGSQVAYMPMIAGIRQRMRNSGEVLSAEAHVVYSNDEFHQEFGDNPAITHKPPQLGGDRGEPVGAYAIIKLKNGETLREIMDKREIERVRAASKSANGPAWKNWWGEMARKSVLRRCAKAAPTSADIDELLARDDESSGAAPMVDITPHEPEPPRGAAITHQPEQEREEIRTWLVVDCDGEEHEFSYEDAAWRKLVDVFSDAERRGPSHVTAARENNSALIAELGEPQPNSPAGTTGNHAEPKHQTTGKDAQTDAVAARNARPAAANPPAGGNHIDDMLGGATRAASSYRVPLPDLAKSEEWAAWELALLAMIDAGDPKAAILRDNQDNIDIFEQVNEARHNRLVQALGAK